MNRFYINVLRLVCITAACLCGCLRVSAQSDSSHTYPYPIYDRYGDPFTWRSRNAFDLDTALLKRNIVYDSATHSYFITELIDSVAYRYPVNISQYDFLHLQGINDEHDYYNNLSKSVSMLNLKQPRPKPRMYKTLFNKVFGLTPDDKKMNVSANGNIDLQIGYQGQNIENPVLSEQARKTGSFMMNSSANLSMIAQVGNKLRLPVSFNSNGSYSFNLNNQFKLNYQGSDDELLKSVQAGNVSFQTRGTLMASMQNLFGIEAQLHLGNLMITGIVANDRSQKQSVTAQSGGLSQSINISMGNYDLNRNFLLGNYFEQHFNQFMSNLPVTNSLVRIMRMEVWVTNTSGATTNVRTVAGMMDLGENQPYNNHISSLNSYNGLPDNGANNLYSTLANNPAARNPGAVSGVLNAAGLVQGNDYELTYARKLDSSEYIYNPQLGVLLLNSQVQPGQVLAVAYQYTYNGRVFQVGEFSSDVALDSTQGIQKVLFVKLLKGSNQVTNLPTWGWMMKNVYALNMTGMDSSAFNLNVYYQQPSGGTVSYMPQASQSANGRSIISVLGADRLNVQRNLIPDGEFDYVPGFTVIPMQGKIIFPVLEPFGNDLDSLAYSGVPQSVSNQYVYYQLYDSIQAIANTYPNLNRFVLQGVVKGSSTSVINIGATNIPPGSVVVSSGGRTLTEGVDYIVQYDAGTVQIINQAILSSGVPVNVQYENNANLGAAQRNFMGLRLDYKVNRKLWLGATMEKLSETPYNVKTNYGEDPVNNSMYGVDASYHSDAPQITKWLNMLPFYSSSAPSSITAFGEAATIKPGHPKQINGMVYIDDFESSSNSYDLRTPFTSWSLASTPADNGLFPEADLSNDLAYGKNRAQLAWYTIEPTLQDPSNTGNPLYKNLDALSDPRVRAVYTNELFPNQSTLSASLQTTTFDLSYYPAQRGQYNYTDDPQNINANGLLTNPQQRWGGLMRSLDQTDFISNNIQYIEIWVQDPFIKDPNSLGGKLMIDLGNISEDILKDGKHEYENGLSTPSTPAAEDSSSVWGTVPANPIQLVNGFDNNPADRPFQDVGLDGLADQDERRKRAEYLQNLAQNFGVNSEIYQTALNDPSADDYVWYRDPRFTANDGILERYKHYNGTEGNSPVASSTTSASTTYPDNEDINNDNTMNQTEQYYEYEVDLKPGMTLTDRYVADVRIVQPKLANDSITQEHWYLLRIPITDFTNKIGNISDFTSIRFMRMYLTGFQDSATIRFAELSLVRNTWRNFTYVLDTSSNYTNLPSNTTTTLSITEVNTQDNSLRSPIPYKMPPGVQQQQSLQGAGSVSNGSVYLEKEQSMSLNISNLNQYDARAVIKNMDVDMRRYGQMSMFIHAESVPGQTPVNNNDLVAVIRLGQDFVQNYYEIRIPLQVTQFNENATPEQIWPDSNKMVVALQDLVNLKLQRDAQRIPLESVYRQQFGYETYSVKGNPNIAQVTSYLIGVENQNNSQPLSCDVWVDELALSQMSDKGGWAAQGRVDMQLADLGTVSLSANTYSAGWGSIEQNEEGRAMNSLTQFDLSATLNLGRLFPKQLNFNIPFYASINKSVSAPEYDPYDQDVLFSQKLKSYTASQKDSAKAVADTRSTTNTFSFTNVRFGKPSRKPKIWDISNFDFSYTYTKVAETDPLTARNDMVTTSGGIGYTYNGQPMYWQPFKRVFNNKSPWLSFIRDFNINPVPSLLSFRYMFNRQSAIYTPRVVNPYGTNDNVDSTQSYYNNFFNLTRNYNLNWNLTKSLNIDFTAANLSVVDEPYGPLNTKAKRDSVWHNLLRGGRNTQYSQTATLAYKLPFNKFPMLDWIDGQYSYSATYNWISANLQNVSLGNAIENGNTSTLNANFNFRDLYNKSKLLKAILDQKSSAQAQQPKQRTSVFQQASLFKDRKAIDSLLKTIPKRRDVVKGLHGRAKRAALRRWHALKEKINLAAAQLNAKQPQENSAAVETGIRLLTMVKSFGIGYTVANQSRLPGFMDSSKVLGEDLKSGQPGFGYIFGKMPTQQWLMNKAARHLITEDSTFNDEYSQTYTSGLNLRAEVEPFKDLIIDLTAAKSFSKNYTTLFKDTSGNGNYQFLTPYSAGGFNVSYMTYKGLFEQSASGSVSNLFQNFSNFRQIISQRLGAANPYNIGMAGSNGYAYGYGQYAQNVLIPAFLAAYTGKSPEKVGLVAENNPSIKTNPLGSFFPMPNWTLSYSGLNKIGNLSKIFSNITITDNYSGSLGMNSFTSALNFQDPLMRGQPAFIDTISGNYVPYFLIPNITISESFQPLIGINATLVNQSTLQFSYSKTRTVSLSLVDYQVSESNMTSYQFGLTVVKHDFKIPFLSDKIDKLSLKKPPKGAKGQQQQQNNNSKGAGNDLTFGLNMSMTNQFTGNSTLDQSSNNSTGGQKMWMFSPFINYVINNRFSVKLFYTQNKTVPYISTSPPITTVQAGLEIKMAIQ